MKRIIFCGLILILFGSSTSKTVQYIGRYQRPNTMLRVVDSLEHATSNLQEVTLRLDHVFKQIK